MSIANEISRLQTAKADIKSAIEAKGVSVPSSASISTYDDYVLQIQTGGGGGSEDLKQLIQRTITSIDIPSGTTSIGDRAFAGCNSLSSVTIPNTVTHIYGGAFNNCNGLSDIIIPDSVTSIDALTFGHCSGLTNVTIGSGVTTIGQSVFTNCSALSSITIPNSVTSIGISTFNYCISLPSIEIPSGVTSIGNNAFSQCSSLSSVTVNATVPPTLGSNVFNNTNNCPIYVPCESVSAYKAASNWSTYASRIQCEAQYRTTSGTPYCQGYDKYVDVYSQVSNDGGVTWTTTATTPTLVEVDSQYCGYEPTPTCETPENLETFALDDDFDTTKEVWNLWPNNITDFDGDGNEDYYYFENAYVVLSEDGQNPTYTILANITDDGNSEVDICEYDANEDYYAGTVLTALTESGGDDFYIGMCDYFEKPMYVMDFSQYLVGEWQGMDENEFNTYNKIYKVKMNAQDIYDTYGLETFSGQLTLNDADDGSGTVYEVGYNVELVDDHLEASIDIIENYEQVTSYTFNLSEEEVIIDFYALFGKALYATSCDMLCVDGDEWVCQEYATLWDAFVETIGWINEFEVEVESEE